MTLVDEITRAGGKASAVATDVTDPAQVQALVDAAVEQHGRVDVMLNNAGVMPHSPLDRRKIDDWNRTIDINIKGVLYGIAAALPHMQRQKAGHIINVSSVAGHKVGKNNAVYAATKTAVRVITEGLRQEVKPWNLRTTIISPGAVATELPSSITEADVAKGIGEFYEEYAIPAGVVRARRGVCDRSAGRCRYQRDSLPADAAGTVANTLSFRQSSEIHHEDFHTAICRDALRCGTCRRVDSIGPSGCAPPGWRAGRAGGIQVRRVCRERGQRAHDGARLARHRVRRVAVCRQRLRGRRSRRRPQGRPGPDDCQGPRGSRTASRCATARCTW